MKKQVLLFFFLLCFTLACKKTQPLPIIEQPLPQPIVVTPASTTKGSLSGKVSPAESISAIIATASQDGKKYTIPLGGNGAFGASELPEGSYSLAFTTNDFYSKPAPVTVQVKEGKETEVGTIIPAAITRPLLCYVNGQFQSFARKGYYSGTLLQIVKYTLGTGIPENDIKMKPTYDLGITLSPFTGPGTYICDPSTKSRISYKLIKGALPISIETTESNGGAATVTITSIDPLTRTIKGSFSGTLSRGTSISNGVINTTY